MRSTRMCNNNQNSSWTRERARSGSALICGLVIALTTTVCFAQSEHEPDVVLPIQLDSSCRPTYPPESRKLGQSGKVVVKVLIDRNGVPSQAALHESSGHKPLDEAALAAVSCFRFRPGTKGGAPIDMWMRAPIAFKLEGAAANFIYRDADGNIRLGQQGFWDKFVRPPEK